ncbi:sigma-70 family RNA polymerase sigma factor [Pontibacillus yanchengensis]|uniref:Sigma-70 family RNA polymerase sigma factor n=2 Tax=Pontibacillus yanchengensis TaxID=462910 RepID=A0ACC7VCP1_9BACI|nr:RNA polymerase sigma factor SigX [Pontibacillus yanchengensis]MYL35336.1 sigma-70 family RNA polymerase sigma factor [Pontibacillus yanchengensis]MYL52365.1 sigma-70 family RNA polymerase sigma factor [Pontibacillus yanchengensis]
MEVKATVIENLNTTSQDNDASYIRFQRLFKTYYPRVVRKVMTIVKNKQAAEDIAQEVFMKLYHTDWETIEHMSAWLMTTAVNTAYNNIRSEKRHKAREEKQTHYSEQAVASIEETFMIKENVTEVQEVLKKLTERDRTILLLKYSGYNYYDIASAIHVEHNSVGSLLARAKMRFKSTYNQMKGEGSSELR